MEIQAVCSVLDGECRYNVQIGSRLDAGMSEARAIALMATLAHAAADILAVQYQANQSESIEALLGRARRWARMGELAGALRDDGEPSDDAAAIALGSSTEDAVLLWFGATTLPMRLSFDDVARAIIAIRRAIPQASV